MIAVIVNAVNECGFLYDDIKCYFVFPQIFR